MRILFDTSALVAGAFKSHPKNGAAESWLAKVTEGDDDGYIAAHSLAESYSVMTTAPLRPELKPIEVAALLSRLTDRGFQVITLSDGEYFDIIERLVDLRIVGGAIYDALIAYCAIKANADAVVTFNQRDFARVCPELADRVISP